MPRALGVWVLCSSSEKEKEISATQRPSTPPLPIVPVSCAAEMTQFLFPLSFLFLFGFFFFHTLCISSLLGAGGRYVGLRALQVEERECVCVCGWVVLAQSGVVSPFACLLKGFFSIRLTMQS